MVSRRRIGRVAAEYIRARQPLQITFAELREALEADGYLTGDYQAKRMKLQRALKQIGVDLYPRTGA